MAIQSYKDLTVWQKSMDVVVQVYRLTDMLPKQEQFGLISQMRRAAVSVPSNIAEGHGRLHKGDFLRHLSISRGSLMELETQLEIAMRLGYLQSDQVAQVSDLLRQTGRLLNGLIRSLGQSATQPNNGRIFEISEPYKPDSSLIPDP